MATMEERRQWMDPDQREKLKEPKLYYYIGQIEEKTGEHNFNCTIVWSGEQPHQPNLYGNDKQERDCAAADFLDEQCKFWYGGEEDDEGTIHSHDYNEDSGWYSKDYDEYAWRYGGFKEISKKTFKEVQPFVTDMTGCYKWKHGQ